MRGLVPGDEVAVIPRARDTHAAATWRLLSAGVDSRDSSFCSACVLPTPIQQDNHYTRFPASEGRSRVWWLAAVLLNGWIQSESF